MNALDELLKSKKVDFTIHATCDSPHFGWIAPDGSFYYTTTYEHLSLAYKIAEGLYNDEHGDDCLYDKGWLSIHPYGIFDDFLFVWHGHLSMEQKHVIKPFVEENIDDVANLTKDDLLRELDMYYDDSN